MKMKIKKFVTLIETGMFSKSPEFSAAVKDIKEAAINVVWPPGANEFRIYPQSGKKRGQGSGVVPIRKAFVGNLISLGWEDEKPKKSKSITHNGITFTPFDARFKTGDKYFVVEWETGNISSSHRALNKMALALMIGAISGGTLVMPTRKLYKYLTDRVGNYEEITPYFPLWRSIKCDNGFLGVMAVEYDVTDVQSPRIPKGTNGRALM